MGFSRQEYWDELPCPLPGGLPKPGVEPKSPTLQVDSLPAELPGKPRTYYVAAAAAKSLQLCQTLCGPIDSSPSGCAIPGILQARTLEWVAISFSNQCMKVKSESEVAHSCLTLRDYMDCSLPGSSVHGIFQARVLEWAAIAFSRTYYDKPPKRMRRQKFTVVK